jgi:hypothetical protein
MPRSRGLDAGPDYAAVGGHRHPYAAGCGKYAAKSVGAAVLGFQVAAWRFGIAGVGFPAGAVA